MRRANDLEKLIIGNKPVCCELCGGKMFYVCGGKYECEQCGNEILDDYGKVKQFLETNGPSPALVVSKATGVKPEIIELFLKKGRVEIPEGSKYYLKCERCECSIRYGRYCPQCVKEMTGSIQAVFNEEVGERPRHELNPEMQGKMRYFDRKIRERLY